MVFHNQKINKNSPILNLSIYLFFFLNLKSENYIETNRRRQTQNLNIYIQFTNGKFCHRYDDAELIYTVHRRCSFILIKRIKEKKNVVIVHSLNFVVYWLYTNNISEMSKFIFG